MKKPQLFLIAMAAVLVVVIAVLWTRQQGAEELTPTATGSGTTPGTTTTGTTGASTPTPTPTVVSGLGGKRGVPLPPEPKVTVTVDETLARVNGEELTLKDLLPASLLGDASQKEISAAEYKDMLDRAIGRKLVWQEAKAQRVGLGYDQQLALQAEREKMLEARAKPKMDEASGVRLVSTNQVWGTDVIDFAMAERASKVMQFELMKRAGVRPMNVTSEDVRKYYDENKAEFGELPSQGTAEYDARWAEITGLVTDRMKESLREQALQQREAYLAELWANAKIEIVK